MNITLQRTTLMVCMLAGALALAVALLAAKDVSAAPPEPVEDSFTVEGVRLSSYPRGKRQGESDRVAWR